MKFKQLGWGKETFNKLIVGKQNKCVGMMIENCSGFTGLHWKCRFIMNLRSLLVFSNITLKIYIKTNEWSMQKNRLM